MRRDRYLASTSQCCEKGSPCALVAYALSLATPITARDHYHSVVVLGEGVRVQWCTPRSVDETTHEQPIPV
ncbi:hypothetical protein BIW11_04346 [Tropilaelaps mercedesae]|uniref:Uncharacterized protein n=1 Tax=Tropilaelaps mercedesae TaxID=418985 RepID=A0A1V9X7Q2_9ACAR|nr:hypothetical protein BIW11_04346 [Tropilaelaps mercedesae]